MYINAQPINGVQRDLKLSPCSRLNVQWDAEKQNDTLSRDYNRPNPLFWPFWAASPVSLHLFLHDAPLRKTSRLLTSPFSPDSGPFLRYMFPTHTHIEYFVYMRMQNPTYTRALYPRYIYISRGRSEYILSGNTIIYRGKILALVDLLAEIRAVMVDSYET